MSSLLRVRSKVTVPVWSVEVPVTLSPVWVSFL